MPLPVVSFCTYLTDAAAFVWRRVDYDAHDFVLAIKGRSINGYAYVPCGGTIHRIEDSNRDLTLELFAQTVAAHCLGEGLARPVTLVPVPNSRTDVRATAPPRTLAQARALARHIGPHASVADVLRWRSRMLSARAADGPRDPQSLLDELVLAGSLPQIIDGAIFAPAPRRTVVLVDDVITSGGHLQAAAAMLRARGTCDIRCAVVAGRSDKVQVDDPFALRVETLPDFIPQDCETPAMSWS